MFICIVDLGLDVATFTSFEVIKIKLGMNVIFISLTSLLSHTSGFEKEKWTITKIGAIFFVWFSSCYMLGIYDTIFTSLLCHKLAIILSLF